jgi:hypothetical protein
LGTPVLLLVRRPQLWRYFGEAILFGLTHSYQGVKQMVVITALGVLYGALAAAAEICELI